MLKDYRNAFSEVYEIIKYLDDDDYYKIPKDIINVINEYRNKEYKYYLDESLPLKEQRILPETKAILFNIFRDYLSTKEQKDKIVKFQITQMMKLEVEKEKNYNKDIFIKKN